jgi:sister-chromatid-cohesion protein PDS5
MDIDVKPNTRHDFSDWCADEDFLPEHQACILGLKVLTNYVLARALAAEVAPDTSKATGVFKVLGMLLDSQGRHPNFRSGPGLAGRLRLQAATSLLKLAQAPALEKFVMHFFSPLAWSLQDQAFQVRGAIVHKLIHYCHMKRLPSFKYNTLLFVTAHDPDPENMMMAQKFVSEKYKTLQSGTQLL